VVAQAQQPVPVIGWLDGQSPEAAREFLPPFQGGLAETGYVEGRNVIVEYHWAENDNDRLLALAADLVRRRVAVIVALTTSSALAAKAATQTIPIVFSIGSDPVTLSLVASLNRPIGNLTGVAALKAAGAPDELVPKTVGAAVPVTPTGYGGYSARAAGLSSASNAPPGPLSGPQKLSAPA
jgi:putative ABC transport system substrate-binding protein